jgi:hypothetical protein
VAFWLTYSFAFDDTEPLPSMFRRKATTLNATRPPASVDHSGDITAPAAGLSIFRVSNMTASYIMAGVLFVFAMVDASLLMTARFPPDEMAVTWSAPEKSVAEAAAQTPSAETVGAPEALAIVQAGDSQSRNPRGEVNVNASTQRPIEAAVVCAQPQFNCWRSATFIR